MYLRNTKLQISRSIARIVGMFSLVGAIFLAFSPAPAAADDETDRFLQEIRDNSAQVHSFSSEFVQERRLALFAEPVIFHGKLTVVRPDRLRWEFTAPVASALIFNGKVGMRCQDKVPPAHFDLGSDPIMRTVAEQLWLWLGGDYSKLGDKYGMESRSTSLIITPKDQATMEYMRAVTITFSADSKQPEKVLIDEPGGDSTLISFKAYSINKVFPETFFSSCGGDE